MLSCNKATLLISKQLDQPLQFSEKVQLAIHLWGCQLCKLFERQMLLMRNSIRELADETMPAKPFQGIGLTGLTETARTRVLKAIRSELNH